MDVRISVFETEVFMVAIRIKPHLSVHEV